jgi:hypothetical protein
MSYKPPFHIELEPLPAERKVPVSIIPQARHIDRYAALLKKIKELEAADVVTLILLILMILVTDEKHEE